MTGMIKHVLILLKAILFYASLNGGLLNAQTDKVNVFLGTSGDHGQLSPAASYPFSMLSIGPQTYPKLHAGYEYEARRFLGFTHNRFEGVGCMGSGGNILIKPFAGDNVSADLIRETQSASPGYYQVSFKNKINAEFAVYQKAGMHRYHFPEGKKGFVMDLSHSLANRFVDEQHEISENSISGWVKARTTCNAGTYKIYYHIRFSCDMKFQKTSAHTLLISVPAKEKVVEISVALSSVSEQYAKQALFNGSFEQIKAKSDEGWNQMLSRITVKGDAERENTFYSLLYRTLQSPYVISEKDGTYRNTKGEDKRSEHTMYNGWAIWDNYRTQLPLLSVGWPDEYQGMTNSIANLFLSGKQDFATQHEPSNTVRTEHAIVVLLDAYRKGYEVNFEKIADSLMHDVDNLDFSTPDKALESSYDTWAMSDILSILNRDRQSEKYREKAREYRSYWNKDFKDLTKSDVDKVQARGLYQGTIWQYRWFVPFDVNGLIALTGGPDSYIKQLDHFFDEDMYNHANEPDLQAPLMYNVTPKAWKSQELMHRLAVDTVIQYYFNDNSKGIDPFVDVIYKNKPKAYIRTMDDDGGAMSAWYVLTACGFSPACPGWPVYYLHVPLFQSVSFNWPGKKHFEIEVENYSLSNKYIKRVILNGVDLKHNYITHDEITNGGKLVIVAASEPQPHALPQVWMSELK